MSNGENRHLPDEWDSIAGWGRTGEIPPPPEVARPWTPPDVPPWVVEDSSGHAMPAWAMALVTAGALLLLYGGFMWAVWIL